jgi:hypothetical protein
LFQLRLFSSSRSPRLSWPPKRAGKLVMHREVALIQIKDRRSFFEAQARPTTMSASLIGRLGSSNFQTIDHHSVDVARGLVLLFGIGATALPSWDSKTRRNNLLVGLTVRRTAGPGGHANSPHPSSREGHPSTARGSRVFLLSVFDLVPEYGPYLTSSVLIR